MSTAVRTRVRVSKDTLLSAMRERRETLAAQAHTLGEITVTLEDALAAARVHGASAVTAIQAWAQTLTPDNFFSVQTWQRRKSDPAITTIYGRKPEYQQPKFPDVVQRFNAQGQAAAQGLTHAQDELVELESSIRQLEMALDDTVSISTTDLAKYIG